MSNFGQVRMGFEDSPYALFEQGNSAIDTNLEGDEEFARLLTSHGRGKFGGSGFGASNRPPTTAFRPQNETNRPITAVTGANYKKPTSATKFRSIESIDPLNEEQQDEAQLKEAEKKVSRLVDASIVAFSAGDTIDALEKLRVRKSWARIV